MDRLTEQAAAALHDRVVAGRAPAGTPPLMVTLTVLANGGAHTFWVSGSAADLQPLVDAFKASRGVTDEPWLEFTSADDERIVFEWLRVDGLSIAEHAAQDERKRRILGDA